LQVCSRKSAYPIVAHPWCEHFLAGCVSEWPLRVPCCMSLRSFCLTNPPRAWIPRAPFGSLEQFVGFVILAGRF